MRGKSLIKGGSPCDTDFTDGSIQSITDALAKGKVFCFNREQCEERSIAENIQCYRTTAKEMAEFILDRKSPFEKAVQEEKENYLRSAPDGKFWVCQNGKWQVVMGKENVVNDIVAFALVIIDRQPRERGAIKGGKNGKTN